MVSYIFHPSDDLIVSASLDQTVRVWDTNGLKKKEMGITDTTNNNDGVVGSTNAMIMDAMMRGKNNTNNNSSSRDHNPLVGMNVLNELFGSHDVVVKYVLKGHDRGVN